MDRASQRVAVYTIVRGRLDLTRKSIKMLRQWAGIPFHHYVVHNGDDRATNKYLKAEAREGRIKWLMAPDKNYGQNIAANFALDAMADHDYDAVLRWDPDAIPRTRRFLKKLVRCQERFAEAGVRAVLSPEITKLKHPPETRGEGDDIGFRYQAVEMLGGICRLHPRGFFDGWRFNQFGALGFGEAAEAADRAVGLNMPRLRLPHLRVEHAYGEDGQAERWPEEFTWEAKEVGRYVGYGL